MDMQVSAKPCLLYRRVRKAWLQRCTYACTCPGMSGHILEFRHACMVVCTGMPIQVITTRRKRVHASLTRTPPASCFYVDDAAEENSCITGERAAGGMPIDMSACDPTTMTMRCMHTPTYASICKQAHGRVRQHNNMYIDMLHASTHLNGKHMVMNGCAEDLFGLLLSYAEGGPP